MMSALICILQGQKDLPAAFDKQDKDQFVADCKEVNICCCCSFVLMVLMLIISLRPINCFFCFQSLNTASESYKKIYFFSWKCFQVHTCCGKWKECLLLGTYMNCISRIQGMLDYIDNLYLNPSLPRQLTRTGTARFELPHIKLN